MTKKSDNGNGFKLQSYLDTGRQIFSAFIESARIDEPKPQPHDRLLDYSNRSETLKRQNFENEARS